MKNNEFQVKNKQIKQTKHGKDFLAFTITDIHNPSASYEAKIWPEHYDKLVNKFNNNDIIKIKDCKEESYNNQPQIIITNLEVTKENKWGCSIEEAKALYKAIETFAELNIEDADLKLITLKTLEKYAANDNFFTSPAAKSHHHNYPGGLLIHTWEVCNLAIGIKDTGLYSQLNWDIILSACILHDLGKLYDYKIENGIIGTTDLISLTGHLVSTPIEIYDTAKSLNLHESKTFTYMLHAVLAHHGKKEYGSPQTPATKEAWMVHFMDLISSQISDP